MELFVSWIISTKFGIVNIAAIGGTITHEKSPPNIHMDSQDQPFTFLYGT
ncbi:hypothetical protein COLO4_01928 [Corchorus olitorius]|uniref:Uncharacterized protein n=1 Tax=Corchorus olitorius TaxID=93759 RepID=A0A1R3L1S1_9ROSI|nr:hypothetical protein COLO4_01928 [Corchorus olitorius]